MENNTAYVTFTGKASLVLREKGLPATTIHKLIYECQTDKFGNLEVFLKQDIDENIKIIVIDEISMVSKELLQDLLKFNRQIIALGDIGQLEPIGDDNGLLKKPDYVLTEIIRQAADNPIIYLSKLVRENKFDRMNNDKVKVLSKKDFDLSMVEWADQCLCGFNQTRKFINESMRKYYFNIKFDLPVVGDKVISLKNCWKTLDSLGNPLINGTICKIKNINASVYNGKIFKATLQDVDTSATYSKLQIDTSVFKNEPIDFKKKLPVFDYGYAITTHKAQGSEYNKVLLIDECLNKETYNRWLYTAITRAKDKLVIIKD
jgi:exodeoxyribonuclease-5